MESNNKLGVEFNAKPNPVPDKVKVSTFGCVNCLWNCIECKSGSMYKPKGEDGCGAYTYYD